MCTHEGGGGFATAAGVSGVYRVGETRTRYWRFLEYRRGVGYFEQAGPEG